MGKVRKELWDADLGPYNKRVEEKDNGKFIKLPGAACRMCGQQCSNSDSLRLLGHICADTGVHGWKPCLHMPDAMKHRFMPDFEEAVSEKLEKKPAAEKVAHHRHGCSLCRPE